MDEDMIWPRARAQLATASRFVSPQSRHDIAKILSWVPLSSMSRIAWSMHTDANSMGSLLCRQQRHSYVELSNEVFCNDRRVGGTRLVG